MAVSNFNRILFIMSSVSFQWREEGIGDMIDAVVVGSADYGNDVELGFVRNVVGADIDVGGTADSRDFFRVDRVDGVNEIVLAGFDFHEDDILAFHRHDVDFIMSRPPISFDDGISCRHEGVAGDLFAPMTGDIVLRHYLEYPRRIPRWEFSMNERIVSRSGVDGSSARM